MPSIQICVFFLLFFSKTKLWYYCSFLRYKKIKN